MSGERGDKSIKGLIATHGRASSKDLGMQSDAPRRKHTARQGRAPKSESEVRACTRARWPADNDAILCIGYSAHIRGRILRVDLSLSSLLGMHVRRSAIMQAGSPVRERPDGRSSLGLGYNTMSAYTGGIYEREH